MARTVGKVDSGRGGDRKTVIGRVSGRWSTTSVLLLVACGVSDAKVQLESVQKDAASADSATGGSSSSAGGGPGAGTERGACYPNDSCNKGLTCLSGVCVNLDGGGAGGKASTGGASAGGGSSSGGNSSPDAASSGGQAAQEAGVEAGPGCSPLNAPDDPGGPTPQGSYCCTNMGRCVDQSTITDPVLKATYGMDSCASGLECVPNLYSDGGGQPYVPPVHCTAKMGASLSLEGRCLPTCFTLGLPFRGSLAQDGCKYAYAGVTDVVCAPCYDPMTGGSTGACTMFAGDHPTSPAPVPFTSCDGAHGVCAPAAWVAGAASLGCPSGTSCVCNG